MLIRLSSPYGEEPSTDEKSSDSVEDFWKKVEFNLRQGVIRLLFVGDELPRELRRIIEFLNEHMTSVEVLAIEITQYVGGSVRALVPRLVGQTEANSAAKREPGQPVRRTTPEEFLASCPEEFGTSSRKLFAVPRIGGFTIYWGTKGFSFRVPSKDGGLCSLLYGYPPGADGRPTAFMVSLHGPHRGQCAETENAREVSPGGSTRRRGHYILRLKLDSRGPCDRPRSLGGPLEVASELVEE